MRDPRTGRLSQSKWAKGVPGAGLMDLVKAGRRALYAMAHGDPQEGATLAAGVTKIGEFFGAYLDDKPATGPRVTKIVLSTEEPRQDIPPEQGRRQLPSSKPPAAEPGEDGFVEVREEEAP